MNKRRPTEARAARPVPGNNSNNNHAGKRERIVAAALKLFASGPYQAVTMDRVAKSADVAKGTLYLYFPSKEALYLGILSHGLESIARRYQASIDPSAGIAERLCRAIDVSIEFYDGQRDLLRLIATEEPRMAEGRSRLIRSWRERGFQFFTSLIEEGIRTGVFARVDSRLAALVILGGIRSVMLHYGARQEPLTLGNQLGELMLHGLRTHATREAEAHRQQ